MVLSLLYGCESNRTYGFDVKGGIEDRDSLERIHVVKVNTTKEQKESGAIRIEQIEDTAMGLSAQAGLASRAKEINHVLTKHERNLDQIFNFRDMVIGTHVMPPVLVEGRDTLNLTDETTIRLADRSYQIVQQAHFVTNPPTWRDYLWMGYSTPTMPHTSLLPKNTLERAHWQKAVIQGWRQGIKQADLIYQENLARLERDFIGMALYRKLLTQHMVSPPYVSSATLGVTGSKDKLRVNDTVLRITALPQMQVDSRDWRTVVNHG